MARHVVLVLSEATEGREQEFDDWYENVHLDEVLATTGWQSAQRFVLADQKGAPCPLRHLALYDVDADDAGEVFRRLDETRKDRQQSDAFNRRTAAAWVFTATGSRHVVPGEGD